MFLSLHTICTRYSNLLTDIRVAKEAGYAALEPTTYKLERYLDAGYQAEELTPELGSLVVDMISSFEPIEGQAPDEMRQRCRRLCQAAQTLGCQTFQVVALDGLKHLAWPEMCLEIAGLLRELADIAAPFGVRLALEPVAFAPLKTLAQALEVIDATERENIGLNIDTFHIWAGGTPWEEVARLDPRMIEVVHLSDATPRRGDEWSDADRGVFPGEGIIPLKEGIAAIQNTGYDGAWAIEMISEYLWEWDPLILAREAKSRAEALLQVV
jgi:sugar phosphate isomerase/epimerase